MKRLLLLLAVLILFGVPIGILAVVYHLPLDVADRSPDQPIPFSHALHAGDYEIACQFCHRGVSVSPVAGVPPMSTCRACHLHVATDRPPVKAFMQMIEENNPIEWQRVHVLPDHVYFPHMMHMRAGFECSTCHGQVEQMEVLERQFSPKMGWCLECHRENEASIDCWTCHI